MPTPERSDRLQDALYWECLGIIDGEIQLAPLVQIKVRWNTSRTEMLDPKGQKITLDAKLVVAQKIVIDSLLWLGTMDEWHGTGSGSGSGSGSSPTFKPDPEVMQCKAYQRAPDIKNREQSQHAGLLRYRGQPPP